MFQRVLFIKILLVHYSIQKQTEIQAECGSDVTLNCSGVDSIKFLSVAWYKIIGKNSFGIVRRDKDDGKIHGYNFTRPAVFGDKHSLFLSNVMPEDSGVYECEISADLGHRNQYPTVNLIVDACPTQAEQTTTDALNSTQPPDHQLEEDLPVVWSITGVVSMGLVKILLSITSILVIRAVQTRSSRRRRPH